MKKRVHHITFKAGDFDKVDEGEETYYATLNINGTFFHVEAIAVDEDEESGQFAIQDPHGRLEDAMHVDGDGAFETTEIEGLPYRYVIVITPFKN